ncbi:hypothetical protein [Micromonospora sp. NPDC047527]|uniref:hypothetical protein n=1 Tax=unclassified Micromonospora TaxID=2617518 RepID=UPI0033FC9C42
MTEGSVSYARLLEDDSSAADSEQWAQAARTARDSAEELGRLHRLLDAHWRSGRDRDQVDDLLRRLTRRLDEAQDAYTVIAATLANRGQELARARELVRQATAEAHLTGLLVMPAGDVVPPEPAPLAVQAVAHRLAARIAAAVEDAAATRRRAAEEVAALPPPDPW